MGLIWYSPYNQGLIAGENGTHKSNCWPFTPGNGYEEWLQGWEIGHLKYIKQ